MKKILSALVGLGMGLGLMAFTFPPGYTPPTPSCHVNPVPLTAGQYGNIQGTYFAKYTKYVVEVTSSSFKKDIPIATGGTGWWYLENAFYALSDNTYYVTVFLGSTTVATCSTAASSSSPPPGPVQISPAPILRI